MIRARDKRKEAISAIMENMQSIRRRLMSHNFAKDITLSQWAVFATVMRKENIGIKEIAKELDISPSAATQLVDELVNKDYLLKKGSLKDGRAITIGLSKEHRKNIDKLKAKKMEKFAAVFRILSDQELSLYASLNKKIVASFLNSK